MASPKPSQLFFSPAASLNVCLETAADSILYIYIQFAFECTLKLHYYRCCIKHKVLTIYQATFSSYAADVVIN